MLKQHNAFITGSNGGIGRALCAAFVEAGWRVIASDHGEVGNCLGDVYIPLELVRFCHDATYQKEITAQLQNELSSDNGLQVLINNAAIQIVAPVEQLTVNDWYTTLDVNLVAPFVLTQVLLSELQKGKGSVINIASIHAKLTKQYFTAYATSKAALIGLTRSLAVELGESVRINAICPAAIATPMLEAGFKGNPQGRAQLDGYHPSGCIGSTEDLVQAALYLAKAEGVFLNGSIIDLDGGIASKLHDPG